jgi:plastocyanin
MRQITLFFLMILAAASACRKSTEPPTTPVPDAAPPIPAPVGYGEVRGTVTYSGQASSGTIRMTADPFCAGFDQKDTSISVNAEGGLADVVVWVKDMPSEGPITGRAVELVQDGCLYRPRVMAVRMGTVVSIKNGDRTLHNVHTYRPSGSTWFNQAQVPGMSAIEKRFGDSGRITFRCDVHPWMSAYVHVFDHPQHALTFSDGTFDLGRVPAGRRTIVYWHEKLGQKEMTVEVIPDAQGTVTLRF